jgi:hypothetical protein
MDAYQVVAGQSTASVTSLNGRSSSVNVKARTAISVTLGIRLDLASYKIFGLVPVSLTFFFQLLACVKKCLLLLIR